MTSSRVLAVALALVVSTPSAFADGPTEKSKTEAMTRFNRGLQLYEEHDYPAALTEFRKAYELAPTYKILFNIGQVCFQMQDYVCAVKSFERYLAEGGNELSSDRKFQVETDLKTLRPRTAKLVIMTNVPDAVITVDDVVVGKTPLEVPVLVNAGRRKVSAVHEGHAPITRTVDVAGSEQKNVYLELVAVVPLGPPPAHPSRLTTLTWVGFGSTAVLAASGATIGIIALTQSNDLQKTRYVGATPSQDAESKRNRVSRLALMSDVLFGAAAVTLGVTLTLTYTRDLPTDTKRPATSLRLAPSGVAFEGVF